MLELFTASLAEIIKRLQSSCVSMSNSMMVHKLLMFLYFFFWVSCGCSGVLWLKFILWLLKKGSERPYSVCCDLTVILLLLHWGSLLKSPVRMCTGHCSLLPQQLHPQLSIHVIPLIFPSSFFCCFCFTCALFHSCCIRISLKIWITNLCMPYYVLCIFVQKRKTLIYGQEICSFQLCDLLYTGRALWANWN